MAVKDSISKFDSRIEFFQLLRILMHNNKSLNSNLYFKLLCSDEISFPATDLEVDQSSSIIEINLKLLGLIGVDGCLPNYFKDSLLSNNQESKRFKDFLNIFHHRLYLLLFNAWLSNNPDIQLELAQSDWLNKLSVLLPKLKPHTNGTALAGVFLKPAQTYIGLVRILDIVEPARQSRQKQINEPVIC